MMCTTMSLTICFPEFFWIKKHGTNNKSVLYCRYLLHEKFPGYLEKFIVYFFFDTIMLEPYLNYGDTTAFKHKNYLFCIRFLT